MSQVAEMYKEGSIEPLEHITTFGIARLEEAMMFMGKGHHMGKVVIEYGDGISQLQVRYCAVLRQ